MLAGHREGPLLGLHALDAVLSPHRQGAIMTDHNDLAERIERADGPDRALDAVIAREMAGNPANH
ncbi:hypothetical protein IP68_12555 [Blastomonas sp. AAP25]|nr:hypothetical protein IP68_12555 [Blastomonas sp. AAP25]